MSENVIDVEAIKILLIGDKGEIAEGMRLIDAHFRDSIVWKIRQRALSANTDDLFDIYQEVLLGIYKKAKNREFDPDKHLEGFIYKIAFNKAIDWLRRKNAKKRKRDESRDVLVDSVAEIIKDSSIHEAWQYANRNQERGVILEAIRNLIPKLKYRQRQVAEIIFESFPKLLDPPDIKDQILKRYGEDVTTVAVRSARQEVYIKVKEALSIAGYGDYIDD